MVVFAATIPDELPIVAIVVFELVHVPPPVALLSVLLPLRQALIVPVIAAGVGFTDTVTPLVDVHPFDVATTLYTFDPVALGVIVGLVQVVHDKPSAPDMPLHV
jgi:hypothetical protein